MKYEKSTVIISILAILLVLAVGFIIYERLAFARAAEIQDASQRAYSTGVYDTISSLYRQTDNCGVAVVNFVNVSRSVIDVGCASSEKKQFIPAQ